MSPSSPTTPPSVVPPVASSITPSVTPSGSAMPVVVAAIDGGSAGGPGGAVFGDGARSGAAATMVGVTAGSGAAATGAGGSPVRAASGGGAAPRLQPTSSARRSGRRDTTGLYPSAGPRRGDLAVGYRVGEGRLRGRDPAGVVLEEEGALIALEEVEGEAPARERAPRRLPLRLRGQAPRPRSHPPGRPRGSAMAARRIHHVLRGQETTLWGSARI